MTRLVSLVMDFTRGTNAGNEGVVDCSWRLLNAVRRRSLLGIFSSLESISSGRDERVSRLECFVGGEILPIGVNRPPPCILNDEELGTGGKRVAERRILRSRW